MIKIVYLRIQSYENRYSSERSEEVVDMVLEQAETYKS